MDAIICIYFSLQITIKPTKNGKRREEKIYKSFNEDNVFFTKKEKIR